MYKRQVDDRIGYIKVNRFSKETMGELHDALDKLKGNGMKDLVLDLQGNGGGMLEELDPHSVYIPAEDLQQADEPLNGKFEGIGVRFNIMKDTIMVVSTIAGGPSEKLGIMSGDRIVEVDGETVAGIGIRNKGVMDRLKGPKGTHVDVGIRRGKAKELIHFDIERDKIPIYSCLLYTSPSPRD